MDKVQIDINLIKERLGDLEMQLVMKDTQIMDSQNKINELEAQNAELQNKINELENAKK